MNFYTLKNINGFKVALDRREVSYDSEGYEGAFLDVFTLLPKQKSKSELLLVDLNNFYEALLHEVIELNQNNKKLEESILYLANQWGHLRLNSTQIPADMSGSLANILYSSHCKNYYSKSLLPSGMTYAEEEFFYWKVLLTEIIPSSQPWLKSFMDRNGFQLSIKNMNSCIREGINIQYKSLKRSSYDIVPTNILSAITIFSQTKRPRKKKSTTIICAYGPCQNEVPENLGRGRARVTCSDSCRTLKARYKNR